jgi:hypothetical protein
MTPVTEPEEKEAEKPTEAATTAEKPEAETKAEEPAEKSTALPAVARTFSLGWQMAQLYCKPTLISAPSGSGEAENGLPGLSGLVDGRRAEIGVLEIEAGLHSLEDLFETAAIEVPSTEALRKALTEPRSTEASQAAKVKVRELHITILGRLTALDFRLGKSYGLGRALAETCFIESHSDLQAEFNPHRIAQLKEWLADLASALPAHSARATYLSLEQWTVWADGQDESSWATDGTITKRALTRQGRLWRALLSGEKEGTDMLGIDDYTDAADRLVQQGKGVVKRLLERYKWFLLPFAAVFTVLLLLAFFDESTSKALVALGGAAAALGISWKGIGSSLAGLSEQLRKPLWNAELDHAIAEAITVLPGVEKVAIDATTLSPVGPVLTPSPAG